MIDESESVWRSFAHWAPRLAGPHHLAWELGLRCDRPGVRTHRGTSPGTRCLFSPHRPDLARGAAAARLRAGVSQAFFDDRRARHTDARTRLSAPRPAMVAVPVMGQGSLQLVSRSTERSWLQKRVCHQAAPRASGAGCCGRPLCLTVFLACRAVPPICKGVRDRSARGFRDRSARAFRERIAEHSWSHPASKRRCLAPSRATRLGRSSALRNGLREASMR